MGIMTELVSDEQLKKEDKALAMLEEQGIVNVDTAVERWNAYQALCRKLLDDTDYQYYKANVTDKDGVAVKKVKRFPKKSAWQKLARAFNVNTRIIEHDEIRNDKGILKEAYYIVEARLPETAGGRVVQSDASCSKREKGKSNASDHDIRATAKTRATNRAIAELIGAGEVSAEEMNASNVEVKKMNKGDEK